MVLGLVRAYLVFYSPITSNPAAGEYWGIDATIQYGGSNGSEPVSLANTWPASSIPGQPWFTFPQVSYFVTLGF